MYHCDMRGGRMNFLYLCRFVCVGRFAFSVSNPVNPVDRWVDHALAANFGMVGGVRVSIRRGDHRNRRYGLFAGCILSALLFLRKSGRCSSPAAVVRWIDPLQSASGLLRPLLPFQSVSYRCRRCGFPGQAFHLLIRRHLYFVVDDPNRSAQLALSTPRPSSHGLPRRWKRIVTTPFTTCSNISELHQFCSVNHRDFNFRDDPLWPNVSFLHVVEIRAWNLQWSEIIVWKVSILNGMKRRVHSVHALMLFCVMCCPFHELTKARCFQSDGLSECSSNSLLALCYSPTTCGISTTRTDKWMVYKYMPIRIDIWHELIYVSMVCLDRLWDSKGKLEGWRIRLLTGYVEDVGIFEPSRKACLVNSIVELRTTGVRLVSRHEILTMAPAEGWTLRAIQTSDGRSFGVLAEGTDDGPVVFYNLATNSYHSTRLRSLQETDHRFAVCFGGPPPINEEHAEQSEESSSEEDEGEEHENEDEQVSSEESVSVEVSNDQPTRIHEPYCPELLNERECIRVFDDGTIYRTQFQPASLKYSTMKAIFRANPSLTDRLNAGEFCNLTGVNSMQHHFKENVESKWPGVLLTVPYTIKC